MHPTVPAFLLTASSLGEVTVCLSQDLFSLSSVLASPKHRKEAAPEARAGCRRNEHDSDARRFELILASYACAMVGSWREFACTVFQRHARQAGDEFRISHAV